MVYKNELKCECRPMAKQNFRSVWVVLVLASMAPKCSAVMFGIDLALVSHSGSQQNTES